MVNLVKFAIGDGGEYSMFFLVRRDFGSCRSHSNVEIGNSGLLHEYSTLSLMQTYPQLIGFNTSAYEYFVEQYNLTLQYPALSEYPPLRVDFNDVPAINYAQRMEQEKRELKRILELHNTLERTGVDLSKRQLAQQDHPSFALTGTINSDRKCDVYNYLLDYARNYTEPWRECFCHIPPTCVDLCVFQIQRTSTLVVFSWLNCHVLRSIAGAAFSRDCGEN